MTRCPVSDAVHLGGTDALLLAIPLPESGNGRFYQTVASGAWWAWTGTLIGCERALPERARSARFGRRVEDFVHFVLTAWIRHWSVVPDDTASARSALLDLVGVYVDGYVAQLASAAPFCFTAWVDASPLRFQRVDALVRRYCAQPRTTPYRSDLDATTRTACALGLATSACHASRRTLASQTTLVFARSVKTSPGLRARDQAAWMLAGLEDSKGGESAAGGAWVPGVVSLSRVRGGVQSEAYRSRAPGMDMARLANDVVVDEAGRLLYLPLFESGPRLLTEGLVRALETSAPPVPSASGGSGRQRQRWSDAVARARALLVPTNPGSAVPDSLARVGGVCANGARLRPRSVRLTREEIREVERLVNSTADTTLSLTLPGRTFSPDESVDVASVLPGLAAFRPGLAAIASAFGVSLVRLADQDHGARVRGGSWAVLWTQPVPSHLRPSGASPPVVLGALNGNSLAPADRALVERVADQMPRDARVPGRRIFPAPYVELTRAAFAPLVFDAPGRIRRAWRELVELSELPVSGGRRDTLLAWATAHAAPVRLTFVGAYFKLPRWCGLCAQVAAFAHTWCYIDLKPTSPGGNRELWRPARPRPSAWEGTISVGDTAAVVDGAERQTQGRLNLWDRRVAPFASGASSMATNAGDGASSMLTYASHGEGGSGRSFGEESQRSLVVDAKVVFRRNGARPRLAVCDGLVPISPVLEEDEFRTVTVHHLPRAECLDAWRRALGPVTK